MRSILSLLFILVTHDVFASTCCPDTTEARTCPDALAIKCCEDRCFPWWKKGWAVTAFAGPLTSQTSSKIIQDSGFGHSGIVALAGSKELGSFFKKHLIFEYEADVVQHFGKQNHFEIDPAILVARWNDFPWNNAVYTTMAIGDGISIATRKPKLEVKRRGHNDSARTLNLVIAEITLANPCYRQLAFVLRYHHRSGMFGTFHGVHDASTALAAGVKYWF